VLVGCGGTGQRAKTIGPKIAASGPEPWPGFAFGQLITGA
jgi:hypothetical protein